MKMFKGVGFIYNIETNILYALASAQQDFVLIIFYL